MQRTSYWSVGLQVLALVLLAACGGKTTETTYVIQETTPQTGASTEAPIEDKPNARILGRVLMDLLTGVEGVGNARIVLSQLERDDPYDAGLPDQDPPVPAAPQDATAMTVMDGSFFASVPGGWWQLSVEIGGTAVHSTIVEAPSATTNELGPVTLSASATGDTDDDGVSDELEVNGWDIFVNEDGINRRTTRHVTSDPLSAHSDADDLSDGEEFALRSDPRRVDTDGDLHTD